jgi:hypothetical protein
MLHVNTHEAAEAVAQEVLGYVREEEIASQTLRVLSGSGHRSTELRSTSSGEATKAAHIVRDLSQYKREEAWQ